MKLSAMYVAVGILLVTFIAACGGSPKVKDACDRSAELNTCLGEKETTLKFLDARKKTAYGGLSKGIKRAVADCAAGTGEAADNAKPVDTAGYNNLLCALKACQAATTDGDAFIVALKASCSNG